MPVLKADLERDIEPMRLGWNKKRTNSLLFIFCSDTFPFVDVVAKLPFGVSTSPVVSPPTDRGRLPCRSWFSCASLPD
ncbi:hypothetical protein FH063_001128 [Azospirillum argentinense]|uniref:Uncharacterized protein n=1 Tax=Azospirillum argentinense TaxID=2970906 RepID=A0A5B0L5F2_9PROT|nr:hypothetical protein FH063_001128 [Azospirillum argentinense]